MASGRPFLFGTNTKMHQTADQTAAFVGELLAVPPPGDVQRFVIPPYTSLPAATGAVRAADGDIWIGAQNMHWAESGAHTGEISAPMLLALGVDLVLLGHAERRRDAHETDADLSRKVLAAIENGLRVLLCVGETADERGCGVSAETVCRQLKIGLLGVAPEQAGLLQIAYEPVWSIGSGGIPADPADVGPVADLIHQTLADLLGKEGERVPLLYGGSVDVSNAASFAALAGIDGLFVGRAAWSVEGFRAVLAAALAGRRPSARD